MFQSGLALSLLLFLVRIESTVPINSNVLAENTCWQSSNFGNRFEASDAEQHPRHGIVREYLCLHQQTSRQGRRLAILRCYLPKGQGKSIQRSESCTNIRQAEDLGRKEGRDECHSAFERAGGVYHPSAWQMRLRGGGAARAGSTFFPFSEENAESMRTAEKAHRVASYVKVSPKMQTRKPLIVCSFAPLMNCWLLSSQICVFAELRNQSRRRPYGEALATQ